MVKKKTLAFYQTNTNNTLPSVFRIQTTAFKNVNFPDEAVFPRHFKFKFLMTVQTLHLINDKVRQNISTHTAHVHKSFIPLWVKFVDSHK